MNCSDIMKTDLEFVGENETAVDAARRMRDENIGFLPVCDESGKTIGTLTDRDLAIRLVADNRSLDTRVGDLASRDLVWCAPDDDLLEAERLMRERHVSRMLVIDDGGTLRGVISLSDIAQAEEPATAGETLRDVSEREAPPLH